LFEVFSAGTLWPSFCIVRASINEQLFQSGRIRLGLIGGYGGSVP
jgi:hypothetical protein